MQNCYLFTQMFSELQSYKQKKEFTSHEQRIACATARKASATDLLSSRRSQQNAVQLLLQASGPTSFHPFAGQTPSSTSGDNVAHRGLIELEQ